MSVSKADKIAAVIAVMRLALAELDTLRPRHCGRDDSQNDREIIPLGTLAEYLVREELTCIQLTIDALEKERLSEITEATS